MDLLSDPPWYLPVGLAVVAIILLFQGNNRQNKRMKYVGLGLAVAAALLLVLGQVLESDGEKVIRHTRELADAVDKRDWKTFESLLDPKVKFDAVQYLNKDLLVTGAQKSAERSNVRELTVGGLEAKREVDSYIVDFTATATVDGTTTRIPTNWRFHWGKNAAGNDYVLYRIEYVANQFGSDAVLSRMAKP
jgi:hypothetical protein